MTNFRSFGKAISRAVILLALTAFSGVSLAIETSSGVRGVVSDASGAPVVGASVTIKSSDTGLTRSTETSSDGSFAIRNLPVGGNYSVTARGAGYQPASSDNVYLVLGETTDLNFRLQAAGTMEELVVTGARVKTQVAVGPSAAFGIKELETAPAINRNITDVIRIDPRIYVDESRGDINAVQCGGKNSRFNSLTVDGVRTNDSFGLNSNG